MITTIGFQLSPVNGGIKHHVSMDLSKHSRQNTARVQKQDLCAAPGPIDPANSGLAHKEVLPVFTMHATALPVLQPNGMSVNLRHS